MEKTEIKTTKQTGRHYGIDLLRTLSMLMIVLLHITGTGGIRGAITEPGLHYTLAGLLESMAVCAVNCFALISGYIGIKGKYRYSSIVTMWLQVVLYVFLGNVLWYFLFPGSVSIKTIIKSFLPFQQNHYWYFTAYFCMSFFVPLLKRAVNALNRKQAITVCVLIFWFFSIMSIFIRKDNIYVLQLGSGYSVLWVSLLYVVGACVRQHDLMKKVSAKWLFLGYCLCVLTALGSKIFITFTNITIISGNISNEILLGYTSPTIFLCSIFLLGLCSKFPRMPKFAEKLIGWLAPAAFGVYLIHAQPQVYEFFYMGGFTPLASWNAFAMFGGALLAAVIFYVAFAAIDHGRMWLFDKLRIKQRLNHLEQKWIGNLWDDSPN